MGFKGIYRDLASGKTELWKITMLLMCKFTIYQPCSIAMFVYQRVWIIDGN